MKEKVTDTICNESFLYSLIYRLSMSSLILNHFYHVPIVKYCSYNIQIHFARLNVRFFKFVKCSEKKIAKEWPTKVVFYGNTCVNMPD